MIKIICVGKIKERYLVDAINEYKKRISKYTKLEIIEVKDYDFDDINKSIELEREQIERFIDSKDYIISLEIDGLELTSLDLAKRLDNIKNLSNNIVFIIGGSNGLSNKIKEKSDFHLSFSRLTFPHQLFRVLLLEQIYRSYKINNNEKYHK